MQSDQSPTWGIERAEFFVVFVSLAVLWEKDILPLFPMFSSLASVSNLRTTVWAVDRPLWRPYEGEYPHPLHVRIDRLMVFAHQCFLVD